MFGRPWVCQMVAEMGAECITDDMLRVIALALIRLNDSEEPVTATRLLDEHPNDVAWIAAITELAQRADDGEVERAVPEAVQITPVGASQRVDKHAQGSNPCGEKRGGEKTTPY